jgi:cellulose synthase/poly-beta-1,6-N-acetylglucosamine synthase-like glycosyltransferase
MGNAVVPVTQLTADPLSLLSIVIPARDEEGCIRSTVEHLHLELNLHQVPHEIVVVDDGSSDATWQILNELRERIPELHPVQNTGLHGFGRAIIHGLDNMRGDAVVIMMDRTTAATPSATGKSSTRGTIASLAAASSRVAGPSTIRGSSSPSIAW